MPVQRRPVRASTNLGDDKVARETARKSALKLFAEAFFVELQ